MPANPFEVVTLKAEPLYLNPRIVDVWLGPLFGGDMRQGEPGEPKQPPVTPATVTSSARATPWVSVKKARAITARARDFAIIFKLVFIVFSQSTRILGERVSQAERLCGESASRCHDLTSRFVLQTRRGIQEARQRSNNLLTEMSNQDDFPEKPPISFQRG
jgi:hypothetical protein